MGIRSQLIMSFVGVLFIPLLALGLMHGWHLGEERRAREAEFVRAAREAFHDLELQERYVIDEAEAAVVALGLHPSSGNGRGRDDNSALSYASKWLRFSKEKDIARFGEVAPLGSLVVVEGKKISFVVADPAEERELRGPLTDQMADIFAQRDPTAGFPQTYEVRYPIIGRWHTRLLDPQHALLFRPNMRMALAPVVISMSSGRGLAAYVDADRSAFWPEPTKLAGFERWETRGDAARLIGVVERHLFEPGHLPPLGGHGGQLLALSSPAGLSHVFVAASYDRAMRLPRQADSLEAKAAAADLVAFIEDSELYKGLDLIDARLASGVAIAFLVMLGLAWRLSGGYRRSIAKIRDGIEAMGRGDWKQVEQQSKNELEATLVETLNTAMQQTAQRTRSHEAESWSGLVRNIAHEVNNTVAPIKSLAQTLAADEDPQKRRSAELIEERAEALSGFVARCSELARLPPPQTMDVDLARLAASAAQSFAQLASDRGVEVQLDLHSTNARIDVAQFERVLLNLVKNAIEAAERKVLLVVGSEGQSVVVRVENDGQGIAPEARGKLFTPFFTTKPQGSGLGLSLARHIVLAHGGQLTLGDRPLGGTIARVELPRSEPVAHAA